MNKTFEYVLTLSDSEENVVFDYENAVEKTGL